MLFAAVEISDAVLLGVIGVVAMIVKEYFDRQRATDVRNDAREAREAAEAVKKELKESNTEIKTELTGIAKVGRDAHDLANSGMLAQKRKTFEFAEELARDGDPKHVQMMEQAREEYEAHRKTHDEMVAKEQAALPRPTMAAKVDEVRADVKIIKAKVVDE